MMDEATLVWMLENTPPEDYRNARRTYWRTVLGQWAVATGSYPYAEDALAYYEDVRVFSDQHSVDEWNDMVRRGAALLGAGFPLSSDALQWMSENTRWLEEHNDDKNTSDPQVSDTFWSHYRNHFARYEQELLLWMLRLWAEFLRAYPSGDQLVNWQAVHDANHGLTSRAGTGVPFTWEQADYLVLIGESHTALHKAIVRRSPSYRTGTLTVEHAGGRYPHGRIRVVGCTQEDEFKWAIGQFSKKHVSFRDE